MKSQASTSRNARGSLHKSGVVAFGHCLNAAVGFLLPPWCGICLLDECLHLCCFLCLDKIHTFVAYESMALHAHTAFVKDGAKQAILLLHLALFDWLQSYGGCMCYNTLDGQWLTQAGNS